MGVSGTSILFTVETAVADTFVAVGSQRDGNWSYNTGVVDLSSKDSNDFVGAPGQTSGSVDISGLYVPTDAGQVLLQAAADDGTAIRLERVEGVTDGTAGSGTDIQYANFVLTAFTKSAPDHGASMFSGTLTRIGPWAASIP